MLRFDSGLALIASSCPSLFARGLFWTASAGLFVLSSVTVVYAIDAINEVPVRGIVRSLNQATLSTDIRALVSTIEYREGESFSKGDVLVTFDCRTEEARLAAAKAVGKERAVSLESAKYLQGLKAGSTQDVQISEAQFEQAEAEIQVIAAALEGCVLKAPFNGVIFELYTRENELPADGAPIVSIVDIQNSEIELIVSSNWIRDIAPGRRFEFQIDETGETHIAIIRRTSPAVDPASQTIRVYAEFDEPGVNVLPGMSGDATFNLDWQLR